MTSNGVVIVYCVGGVIVIVGISNIYAKSEGVLDLTPNSVCIR
jgi:hypothetical protein